jgi:hypothetical protein
MRLTFFILMLIHHLSLFGQEDAAVVPHTAVKASPLHLLNFYPTIEVSYEQPISHRVAIQVETGYVLDRFHRNRDFFRDKRGVKLKLEGRYYFTPTADEDQIHYFAIELQANLINFDRSRLWTECFDGKCGYPYRREVFYKVEYREQDVSLKWGAIRYIGDHLFLDFNYGLTLRNIHYYEPSLPRQDKGINDEVVMIEIPNEDERLTLSPNMCLRLGWRLR